MRYSVSANKSVPIEQRVCWDKEYDLWYMKQTVTAFYGACMVSAEADSFFGGNESKPFVSKVLVNPTWRQLYGVAKQQKKKTRDGHHSFFEGFLDTGKDVEIEGIPVRVIELLLGS